MESEKLQTPARPMWPTFATGAPRVGFGADYNPEQWPRDVWKQDMEAMRTAGVNIVSLAIFSWSRLQPEENAWDFSWLDDIMDLLHENGIAVDLATATASPPPWLTAKHPEILPVTADGRIQWPGSRQHWRPTSPVFRAHALALVETMAARYAAHPALAAWHVSNELGCHNAYDYSEDAARAFRAWLRKRYQSLDELNGAWTTSFWSQHYSAWEQILPPRSAPYLANPSQDLDFRRFSSDALKDYLRAERDILRHHTPGIPVTTNFMVDAKPMNYADWAGEVDFVSNDHYGRPGPRARDELSFAANLTSQLAGGSPWFLMEHSVSAVNWHLSNPAKHSGELTRDSLTHVAHGADAVCFFQWRQSVGGAERYLTSMIPHAGTESTMFSSVTELGETLRRLAPVVGTRRARSSVAILFDWESWWASEQPGGPTAQLSYRDEAVDWYTAFLDAGIGVDVVPVTGPLEDYRMVIAPILHVMPDVLATRLRDYVTAGGHLVTTYFSGIVDESGTVRPGGYPGALRELLGMRVEEFCPLLDGETVGLDNGTVGSLWADHIEITNPETTVLASYVTGEHAGAPAVTLRRVGAGSAAYVSTRLGPAGLAVTLARLLAVSQVAADLPADMRGSVEQTIRTNGIEEFVFLINRTDAPVTVPACGEPLLADSLADGSIHLAHRAVAVLRRPATPRSLDLRTEI